MPGYGLSGRFRRRPFCLAVLLGFAVPTLQAQQTGKYISPGAMPPGWYAALLMHGDRMQKAGQERMTLTGTITRKGSAAVPVQIIHELPNSIRYIQPGTAGATIVFDGTSAVHGSGSFQKQDTDLLETLAYDTPEAFLYAPVNGLHMRKLGSRFRMDGQTGKVYSGSTYDVYLIVDTVRQPSKVKQQTKYYHVNSDNNLMERVHYQDADSPSTKVQIVLSNWTKSGTNRIPQTIQRLENGVEIFRLSVSNVTYGAAQSDGAFKKP